MRPRVVASRPRAFPEPRMPLFQLPFDPLNWLFAFLRASALMLVFPLFSAANFPAQIRVALGALTAFLVASLLPPPPVATHFITLIGLMILEICVGLLLGFVSRFVFYAVDFAGGLITTTVGLQFSPNPDPFTSTSTQAPGLVLFWLAGMLMFSLNVHHWVLIAFARSFQAVPIGGAHWHEPLLLEVINRSSQIFTIALQMSAPMIAVSFVVTLIFSILGRAVPQMNVFTESFSVRTLVGLAIFGLTLNLMAQHLLGFMRRMPEDLMRVAQMLGLP
jgi:flagellar biosynthesis protein FliR